MRTIFKWLSRLLLCALVIWMLSGILTWWLNKPVDPPSLKDAPYAIQTYSNDEFRIPSRVYYAKEVGTGEDGTPFVKTYWTYNGKNYRKHSGTKPFPVEEYGSITVRRRGE